MEKQLTFDELFVGQEVRMHEEAVVGNHEYTDKDGDTWCGNEYPYSSIKVFTVKELDSDDGTVEIKSKTDGLEYWIMPQFLTPHIEQEQKEPYTEDDAVNHPSHYTRGTIETIDYIEDKELGFHLGNAVKYISRAGYKNREKTIEDLKKAVWFVERQIDILDREWADEKPF